MKIDIQDIIELSEKTSFSRRKCEKVLMDKNNNKQEALEYLMKLRNNPVEIILDNVSAYVTGEKGKKLMIYDNDKILLSFPAIFIILFLLFFNISSWIIAVSLIVIIVFDMDIKIESAAKKTKENFGTYTVSAYQSSRTYNKQSNAAEKNGANEYNEITIE